MSYDRNLHCIRSETTVYDVVYGHRNADPEKSMNSPTIIVYQCIFTGSLFCLFSFRMFELSHAYKNNVQSSPLIRAESGFLKMALISEPLLYPELL